MKKYKVGYTQGVFDIFHIGHLNLIKNAKEQCDYLIVGVNSNKLVKQYKNKDVVITEEERAEIVRAIRYVDECRIVDTLDKNHQWEEFHFDAIFIGSDWANNDRWKKTEEEMKVHGVDVVYLNYTEGVSSTVLRPSINSKVEE